MVLCHLSFLQAQSLQLWPSGNVRRPSEIDEALITLGHSVNNAFQQALATTWDPLGNLDKDPHLGQCWSEGAFYCPLSL